jgi:hypothetical protein
MKVGKDLLQSLEPGQIGRGGGHLQRPPLDERVCLDHQRLFRFAHQNPVTPSQQETEIGMCQNPAVVGTANAKDVLPG